MKKQFDHTEKEFKVEVIEFYPNRDEKRKVYGTLHVYLEDLDLDIRGCPVFRHKNGFIVEPPFGRGIDEETEKPCRFPYFNFCNQKTHMKFYRAFKHACLDYLHKKFLKKPYRKKK